jgi:two-component system OmpR family response regulator
VARALNARGVELAMRSEPSDLPRMLDGGSTILWQDIDDPPARARALEEGAHEVVGPWMHEAETVARILRLAEVEQPILRLGDLSIALVERAGQVIPLLNREYALLLHLARRPNRTVGRRELLRVVWRLDFDPGTNSVEVHMSRLRAKMDRGFPVTLLHTVKGRGYALCPDGKADGVSGA